MATGITAEAINQMIQEALATQAEAHNKELAEKLAEQAARFRSSSASAAHTTPVASPTASSTRSTVPRTRLNMSSPSLVFNGLGGTSTSAMATAAVNRASALASASSSSNPAQEDFYATFARDQTKIEQSLIERDEDPVTDYYWRRSNSLMATTIKVGADLCASSWVTPGFAPWNEFRV